MSKNKFDPFKNLVLDAYEQEIEDAIESGELKPTPIPPKRMKELKQMADETIKTLKRDKNINLRVSEHTIIGLKKKAGKLGLRYQTLANSILHQYATS